MTLRVTFTIVPFGIEERAYNIDVINIHNKGRRSEDLYTYEVVHKEQRVLVDHLRSEGALTLAKKAIEELGY